MKQKKDNNQLSVNKDRRRLLAASAAVTTTAGLGLTPNQLLAQSMADKSKATPNAIKNTMNIGDFEVSTLLAGTRTAPEPQTIFGMNVSAEEFAAVSAQNFIPADKNQFFFTPTVVRAGSEVVLFDTGLNPDGILGPLNAAGVSAEEITIVVVTHMHGDHIGGLSDDNGSPTFPNARYVTGQKEYDAWAKMDSDPFNAKVKPLAEKMSFIGDGDSVISGITSVAANGHTPGHMTYMLESNGQQLLLIADTANHYVWSLAYPDWEVKFDMDKAAAAASRKQILGMLSADKIPFVGYHMPFPGVGYVAPRGEGGFQYVPMTYQMLVG